MHNNEQVKMHIKWKENMALWSHPFLIHRYSLTSRLNSYQTFPQRCRPVLKVAWPQNLHLKWREAIEIICQNMSVQCHHMEDVTGADPTGCHSQRGDIALPEPFGDLQPTPIPDPSHMIGLCSHACKDMKQQDQQPLAYMWSFDFIFLPQWGQNYSVLPFTAHFPQFRKIQRCKELI